MAIRRLPDISEQANARTEQWLPGQSQVRVLRQDPVKPVPEGTVVAMLYRVTGYDPDCDGSLMARLEPVDVTGESLGDEEPAQGLHPDSCWVLDAPGDLAQLADDNTLEEK